MPFNNDFIKWILVQTIKKWTVMDLIANELKSLRMPGMAQCWLSLQETRHADSLSLSDGLQLLLQAEKDQRKGNRNARLIKEARFRYQVSIENMALDWYNVMSSNATAADAILDRMVHTAERFELKGSSMRKK